MSITIGCMSMSMPTCREQSDCMEENDMLTALGKEDGKRGGGGGGMTIRGGRRGGGDEGITKLKTNVISAAAEKKQCHLLPEACLAACSRG